MRKFIIISLVGIIISSLGYLVYNLHLTRQGMIFVYRMNILDWDNEEKVDRLVQDMKPAYIRFLNQNLKSDDYREKYFSAYLLARYGRKEYIPILEEGLRSSFVPEQKIADQLLWDLWFNEAGIDSRQIIYDCQILMQEGQWDEVIIRLTRLLRRKPDFAEAYNQRAIAYFNKGDYERSISDCRNVLELNPIHFGAQSGMGQCYLKLGRYLEAKKAFESTLEIIPHSVTTQELLERINKELIHQNLHIA